MLTKIVINGFRAITDIEKMTYVVSNGVFKDNKPVRPLYKGYPSDCIPSINEYIDTIEFIPREPIQIQDDVKIAFYAEGKIKPMFWYWWHTYFEDGDKQEGKVFVVKFKK